MHKGRDSEDRRGKLGLKLRGYRFAVFGVLFLLGAVAAHAEGPARRTGTVSAVISAVETSQTALAWFPDADIALGRRTGVAASMIFSLLLFLAMGYTWQALDEEEFPDADLPQWFVSVFRRRKGSLHTPQL
jgi:hypothetical protein